LGPHEGMEQMEPAPDLVRVASGPAHGQVRLIGIEDSDGDPGWRGARHALTILGRHENEKQPMSRYIGSWPYPVPDLNRCYRRERAASWAARRTGRGPIDAVIDQRWGTRTRT